MQIDHIDAQILNELQRDARIKTVDLAERVCLSPSPCYRRLKILEENGIIRQYVTLLDQDKIGYPVNVFTFVQLERKTEAAVLSFEEEIAKCEEVMECHLMTGTHDYLLRVVATNIAGYERFIQTKLTRIDGVRDIQSSFSLRRAIYKTALPVSKSENNV